MRQLLIWTCAIWIGHLAMLLSQPATPVTICRDADGYAIQYQYGYLEENRFSEKELTARFLELATRKFRGEFYFTLTSDPELLHSLTHPSSVSSHHGVVIEPVPTEMPIAVFYRLGQNAFYEFRNAQGVFRRVRLRGVDVFAELQLVGQAFGQVDSRCDQVFRGIGFVAPDADEQTIVQIVATLDDHLKHTSNLQLSTYDNFDAAPRTSYRFHSLRALVERRNRPENAPPDMIPGRVVVLSRGNGPDRLIVYQDGKFVMSRNLE